MIKKCKICQADFLLHEKQRSICERFGVPESDYCPHDRLRQMMARRNERKLYRRKCDATGKEIISAYPPDSPFTVYTNAVWWGDTWDATEYGRDYDFNRPFFEQFADLQRVVPREGTSIFQSENADYNSHIRQSRNCYLNSLVAQCEDMLYSYWMVRDKDVVDCMYTNNATLCYECSDVNNAYDCVMLWESDNCNECYFSSQLRGCTNCLFCSDLANKSYYIFNKPCSKEEFAAAKAEFLNGSYAAWQKGVAHFQELRQTAIKRDVHILKCENCTGDHLYNSKNCANCFEGHDAEDCYDSVSLGDAKDIYSAYSAGWPRAEMAYYSSVIRGSTSIAFSTYIWFCTNLFYSDSCVSSQDCFGSIGLRHKKYCILNKQYTKEEYEKLMIQIIAHMRKTGEWGQFFPADLSPCAYNDSAAQDFFPLSEQEALKLGWNWRAEDQQECQAPSLATIPDQDITESITKELLACSECKKNYRIVSQELAFYKKMHLPLPRECHNCRHRRRFRMRSGYELFATHCAGCQKTIQTTYNPQKSKNVYCGDCYSKKIS